MAASKPRYAPPDPTLPKPWRALVDPKSGYLYFWNPETSVTQYERPVADPPAASPTSPEPTPATEASSALTQCQNPSFSSDQRDNDRRHDDSRGDQLQCAKDCNSIPLNCPTKVEQGSSGMQCIPKSAEAYRRQHEITIIGSDAPPPYATFDSTGFPPEMLGEVRRAGFSAPTPIQAQSWPIALGGRDIVAIAKTGSGKTLGYLFPAFILLKRLRKDPKAGPTVLVLSPTRELATQIQDEALKFGRSSRVSSTCLYGGAPKGPQLRDIERGVDIVVATPGRLNDILEMRKLNLRQVSYLVLDEADRMLDMGFEPQIRKVVREIPPMRQTLMFTATWPKEVRKIAADLLSNPVQVNIGNCDELVANKSITQHVEVVNPMEKRRRLETLLRSEAPGSRIIIFCSTKRMCDQLSKTLDRQFGAAAIHGDKSQDERDSVLSQFRSGKSPVLVATDVAARGLDVKDIRVVINYDFPTGVEDYVHRIGRTGRGGATGVSYTFFGDQDSKYAADLVKILEGANQRVPPELMDMVSRGGYGGKSRRFSGGRSDSTYGGGESVYRGWSESGGSENPHSYRDRYDDGGGYTDARCNNTTPTSFGGRGRSISPTKNW